jgi:lipoprotein-anchoring transpeptidase ErfK/SrfK
MRIRVTTPAVLLAGLALLAGHAVAAGGAADAADDPAAAPVPAAPTTTEAWTGRVVATVVARSAPKPTARRKMVLKTTAPFSGNGTVLLITRRTVVDGVPWVEVLLPMRPNGSRGWVPQDVLVVSRTRIRVAIDLSDRKVRVFKAGKRVMTATIAIGKPETPTPTGRWFAIAERIDTNMPGGFLGPIVLPLTGFSETLNEFAGGNGRVAIHGTSLPGLIGTRASHGCMRMRNADIVRFARFATPGTPVAIRA